jgi:hypothetical protein
MLQNHAEFGIIQQVEAMPGYPFNRPCQVIAFPT